MAEELQGSSSPELPPDRLAECIALAGLNDREGVSQWLKHFGIKTVGQRKRLELKLKLFEHAPAASSVWPGEKWNLSLRPEAIPLGLLTAWLLQLEMTAPEPSGSACGITSAWRRALFCAVDEKFAGEKNTARYRQAAAFIPGGALLRTLQLAVHLSGGPGGVDIGFGHMLLVRRTLTPDLPPCRICWGECDGAPLDPTAAAEYAFEVAEGRAPTSELPRGSLLRDICSCRGSLAAAHEGCLIGWLASRSDNVESTLSELRCMTCHQPFVGRASLLLARCAAGVRAIIAAREEELQRRAEEAAANATDEGEAAAAAALAEEAALQAMQTRLNQASALWKSGQFEPAMSLLAQLVCDLN